MAYTPPQFNVFADVWYAPHVPANDEPDVENQACQFYVTPKGQYFLDPPPFSFFPPPIYLRMPFADSTVWASLFICEVPPESGRFFRAVWKELVHLGFPNQYRLVILFQCDDFGAAAYHDVPNPPTPPPGAIGVGVELIQLAGDGIATNTSAGGTGAGAGDESVVLVGDGAATQT